MGVIRGALTDAHQAEALALIERHEANVADQLLADLRSGGSAGMVTNVGALPSGYAQASLIGDANGALRWQIDAVPADRSGTLLGPLVDELGRTPGARSATWWTAEAQAAAVATTLGMTPGRALLQMTVDLPLDVGASAGPIPASDIELRSFAVGVDEDAWLAVNNAAFAWHPEQGGWDRAVLDRRLAEPWFDADGFLVAEQRDGSGRPPMVGFCWTKVHGDVDPPLGEIYIIGVDPAAHGRGLGTALTIAGFNYLARRGLHHGMLYVDADNHSAIRLYHRLGMTTALTSRSFVATFDHDPTR